MIPIETLAYAVSGTFTLLAIILSAWLIWSHLVYNPAPHMRKHIVRILLMVPVYALTSYLALVLNEQKLFFESMRDCYEAFALYSFHCFLIEYLGGAPVLASTLRSKPQVHHPPPICHLRPWTMGPKFVRLTTVGILQYIPTKVVMSMMALLANQLGVYGEGQLTNPLVFYGYETFILSLSQSWALYCLGLFFVGTKEELSPVRPLPKFMAIKLVIFFTYWQSVMINFLESVGVISDKWNIGCPQCWSAPKIASALDDFIICVEMLMFAIAHHYAFSIEDFLYLSGELPNADAPLLANFIDAINVTDIRKDIHNARNEILTKKQALAAMFERASMSPMSLRY